MNNSGSVKMNKTEKIRKPLIDPIR